MDKKLPKKKPPKWVQLPLGYSIGTLSWLLGRHCFEERPDGVRVPSLQKTLRHSLKVSGWTLGLVLFGHGFHQYFVWFLDADPGQRFLALLGKTILFLYIRLFWPGLLTRLLPGLHEFFCPQCYRKQVFRFLPVGAKFGDWVTYLCPNCSCLVNAWGGQIFYPQKNGRTKDGILVPVMAFAALGVGVYMGKFLIKTF